MLSFRIAARFLKASRAQTVLIVLGIAVGVSVQVFVGALIGSLQSSLIDRIIGSSSQVTIVPDGDNATIEGWSGLAAKADKISGVTAVSPTAESPAFLLKSNKSYSVLVRGVQIDRADAIYKIKGKIYQGRAPASPNEIIIGRDLKEQAAIPLGGKIDALTPDKQTHSLTVVGFYDFNIASINNAWVITTLGTAQSIFGYGGNVTSIEMQVREVFKADSVAKDLQAQVAGSGVKVLNWKDQNKELLSGLQGQSISSYMIQVFVLVSVVIAIGSVLAIKVVQKSREIGILKAMGIKDRQASQIFMFQGFILGLAGAMLGIIIGVGLLTSFTMFARTSSGQALIDIRLDYVFIIGSGIVAVLSSTFASLLPARKSFRLSPIEVIRNG